MSRCGGNAGIEVQGLDVRYPGVHALKGVDLAIAPGSFTLIGGASGGGKSTLARALVGLIPRAVQAEVRGYVSVAGLNPQQHSVARLATRVGLVLQNPAVQLFNGTVEEEVAFGPRNLGLPAEEVADRVAYAVRATGCADLRQRAVRRLSAGEQQRVVIAAALAMRPCVLILDEPTANLDEEGICLVAQVLRYLHRRLRVTVVVIEHRLYPFLPHADQLAWMVDGRVVAQGAPGATLARMQPAPPNPLPAPPPSGGPLFTLRRLTAGYGGRPVLRDCSATLCRGDFVGLVGPNGVGKTTLARVLAGVLRPSRGRVVWHGAARRVGLLQQDPLHQLVCDTVEEEVLYGPRNLGAGEDVEMILAQADLQALRRQPTQALSVGQQQRTALAATLSLHPTLLILDEPTVGQDWGHLVQLMDFVADLNRSGQTVLLITHDRRLVERYASQVWCLAGGQIQEVNDDGR
jgi:energy-coupling factor transporter ATP-binding protein EcfA2